MPIYVDAKGYIVIDGTNYTQQELDDAHRLAGAVNETLTIAQKREKARMLRRGLAKQRYLQRRMEWRNKWMARPRSLYDLNKETRLKRLFAQRTRFTQVPWNEKQKMGYIRMRKCFEN